MKTYAKGDNYKEPKDDYWTYGIHEFDSEAVLDSDKQHAQKIEVYGDEKLRNEIVRLLNAREEPKPTRNCAPENLDETVDEPSEVVGTDSFNVTDDQFSRFEKELENAINRTCMENGSNTPDFILSEYLVDCLRAFNRASRDRERWYGKSLKI